MHKHSEWGDAVFQVSKPLPSRPATLLSYIQKTTLPESLRPRKIVIHFHGGPESCEKGEARYGTVFPNLVREGCLYLGWNYPGSTQLGAEWTQLPRRQWGKTILREWLTVKRWIHAHYECPEKNWVLVGGSFGAMVALLVARKEPRIGRVILTSPLLSLKEQITRAERYSPAELGWFKQRFSPADLEELDFESRLHEITAPLSIIASGCDEVLGIRSLQRSLKNATLQQKKVSCLIQTRAKHSPRSLSARKRRSEWIEDAIRNP